MTKYCFPFLLVFLLTIFILHPSPAQEITFHNESSELKTQKIVKATSVKDQGKTGTCWAFSTTSFLESELLRMDKGEHDLSEMYFVRNIYPKKARKYVRMHGKYNFSDGGLSHDVMTAIKEYGIVPDEFYMGRESALVKYDHHELNDVLEGMLDGLLKNNTLSGNWMKACDAVLDIYMGEKPETFRYENKTYTPQSFAEKALGIDPNNYIELTSFTGYPFYERNVLEIPDNWANAQYYNVPLDDFIDVMENALEKGYSIVWDGDVSEREFLHAKGIALVPETSWNDKTYEERMNTGKAYEPEKKVTQEMRQANFDSYTTTDDHLMHIIGLVQDDNGTKYFLTKNSWGADSNKLGGYLYMSEAYVKLKTVAIMVHRDGIPTKIAKKLDLIDNSKKRAFSLLSGHEDKKIN